MKESEAKNKTCPKLFSAMSIAASIAVGNGSSAKSIKELMTKGRCHGSDCVMWEPEYQRVEHEQPKDKEPPTKDGIDIDWRKNLRAPGQPNDVWFRYILTDSGDCGLRTKELECGYQG